MLSACLTSVLLLMTISSEGCTLLACNSCREVAWSLLPIGADVLQVAAQSPTQLQQQQSAPYDAATTAASQAAAALLQEEEKAAQATQQAKGRKAAKKARQKQRKQVRYCGSKGHDTRHVHFW